MYLAPVLNEIPTLSYSRYVSIKILYTNIGTCMAIYTVNRYRSTPRPPRFDVYFWLVRFCDIYEGSIFCFLLKWHIKVKKKNCSLCGKLITSPTPISRSWSNVSVIITYHHYRMSNHHKTGQHGNKLETEQKGHTINKFN